MLVFLGATLLNLYALVLVIARARVYRTPLYRPMLWNIWLSIAPVLVLAIGGLAGLVGLLLSRPLGVVLLVLVGLVWVLLLPNASYLITELNQSHRREDDPVPLWYDIILVISLAMSGVVNTVLNVFLLHFIVTITVYGDFGPYFLRPGALAIVAVVMLLIAFGMYLGRYPRFNSWDVRHPRSFITKLRTHFADRANLAACAGFTGTYAVFLCLMYLVMAGPVIEGLIAVDRMRGLLG